MVFSLVMILGIIGLIVGLGFLTILRIPIVMLLLQIVVLLVLVGIFLIVMGQTNFIAFITNLDWLVAPAVGLAIGGAIGGLIGTRK